MHYPKEIQLILKSELSNLIEMKKKNGGPFAEGEIKKYYQIYKNIVK